MSENSVGKRVSFSNHVQVSRDFGGSDINAHRKNPSADDLKKANSMPDTVLSSTKKRRLEQSMIQVATAPQKRRKLNPGTVK